MNSHAPGLELSTHGYKGSPHCPVTLKGAISPDRDSSVTIGGPGGAKGCFPSRGAGKIQRDEAIRCEADAVKTTLQVGSEWCRCSRSSTGPQRPRFSQLCGFGRGSPPAALSGSSRRTTLKDRDDTAPLSQNGLGLAVRPPRACLGRRSLGEDCAGRWSADGGAAGSLLRPRMMRLQPAGCFALPG